MDKIHEIKENLKLKKFGINFHLKKSQIPGIRDLGIGIPKKSHPKATSAYNSDWILSLILSTPLGYMWMFMLFTFRMFITAVVGGPVYGDESGNFKCDTNQPGCQNVCFNRFSPISHLRFWAFQMLFVCLPSVAFMTYAQFELQKIDVITKKEKEFIEQAGVSYLI